MPAPADGRRRSRAVRVFRALLALYPGEFRDEYGREMALVFADRHRAASTTLERLLVWMEALWGVVTQAPKEHAQMLLQDLRYAVRALRKATASISWKIAVFAPMPSASVITTVSAKVLSLRSARPA